MAFVNLGQVIYPIGAIYQSWSNTSPAQLFGGQWTQIFNKFLYASNEAGSTGGTVSVILNPSQIPEHSHSFDINIQHSDGEVVSGKEALTSGLQQGGRRRYFGTTASAGNGKPHENMPPYYTCYTWRRTA